MQIKDTYETLKGNKLNKNYTNENIIIKSKNAAFQLTQYNNQTNNYNISYVDIGTCEEKIKSTFNIPEKESLIIYKADITSGSGTYVQYEIYHPYTLNKIDLSICKDIPATINAQVNISDEAISLYDSLKKYGYNFFDSNDIFYNDICSTYTSEYGTDLILSDRKELLVNQGNVSLCQQNCIFISYNSSNNMAGCSCQIQTENTTMDKLNMSFSNTEFLQSFYITLSNSNFRVMKCYKLLFSQKGQIKNYGSFILIAIIIINTILMILCFVFGLKKLKNIIEIIMKQKIGIININTKKSKNKIIKKNHKTSKNVLSNKIRDKDRFLSSIVKLVDNKQKRKEPPKKTSRKVSTNKNVEKHEKDEKSLSSKPFKSANQNIFSLSPNKSKNRNKNKIGKNKQSKSVKNSDNKKILHSYSNIYNNKHINLLNKKNRKNLLNDFELNNLEFKEAIKLDKRRLMQIYLSTLKINHSILFAFLPNEDYNLRTIKISLLLISFSLYFTINCFFFSDDSMHKLYINFGKYKFINQLPQMLYSVLISSTINAFLKFISLSGKNMLFLKSLSKLDFNLQKVTKMESCERNKIIIFYILSFFILLFFWYFISCFCAVYINTQKILINDTLISFATSMIYPFGLYLLPSILRIIALKANKENKAFKQFLYNVCLFLS